MSEQETTVKAKRDRSPSYPSIPLGTAVERLAALDEYFKRHPAPVSMVGTAWGIKPASSQAGQTVAALKSFGLVDYQGSGADLKAVVSDDGRTYLKAQQDDIKRKILRQCALKPKAIAKYFSEWGAVRPPDEVCLDELVLKAKFSQPGAKIFLKIYDSTIAYAGLSDSDKIINENGVDDSVTGIPMIEVTLEQKGSGNPPAVPLPLPEGVTSFVKDLAEREWLHGHLSKESSYRLIVTGNLGPKEIGKLIKLLHAQQAVLADDEETEH